MTTNPTNEPERHAFDPINSDPNCDECECGLVRSAHQPVSARQPTDCLECQACNRRSPIRTNPDRSLRDECPLCGAENNMVLIYGKPPVAQQPVEQCTWQVDDATDGEIWETDCGNAFVFETDGPTENKMKFCCYCGKPLKEVGIAYDYQD